MNRQAINTSLFMLSSFASEKRRQGCVYELFHVAEHARLAREFGQLETVVNGLSTIQLTNQEQDIANYFKGYLCLVKGSHDQAKRLLEGVSQRGSYCVRARALASLATLSLRTGDFRLAGQLYDESYLIALKIGGQDWGNWYVYKDKCIFRGILGDHKGASRLLEEGLPAARVIGLHHPSFYLNYLNSYCVELMELNRMEEAEYIMRPVARSPLRVNFQAWDDTLMELRQRQRKASRSVVTVPAPHDDHRILDYCEYVSRRLPHNKYTITIDARLGLVENLLDQLPWCASLMRVIVKILE